GTVILTGENSYAKTTVTGGTLQIGNGGADGNLGSGAVNISNASATLAINLKDEYTIAGLISGAGSFSKEGTNTVILTAENTYGRTTVAGGTLQLGSGGTTGKLGNGDVSLAAGSILLFNRSNFYNVTNVISGEGALVVSMQGGGTIALVGANTYKGGTTVNVGFARATADSGFGDITGGIFLNGGTLMNNDSFLVLNAARTITLGSGGGDFRVGWAKSITVNGRITGTGELRLNNDSGVLILAGVGSDYTGDTTIGVGAGNNITLLRLGASGVLPDGTRVRFNGGVGKTAVLDLNGNTETVGSLVTVSGSGTVTNSAATTTATLTVTPTSGSATYDGLIENGTGVVAVGKTGAGTQEFTGDNTYSGGTTISQGTLLANNTLGSGSALGAGSVLVTSGGRLGGAGSVIPGNGASITVTAGKLMVGNTHGVNMSNGGLGAETLILGGAGLNVSISLNGTLQFDMVDAGSMYDVGDSQYNSIFGANDTLKILTNGALNLDNAIIELAVEDTSYWDVGQTWRLIDWSGAMASSFSAQNLQLLTNNIAGFNIIQHIVESGEGAGYYITLAAVPEPSRALLVLLGAAFCTLRRRRTLRQASPILY
ncbi:MAG TPA: autotransporter-associated beta strand repeat-containing protein, partial [Verrucomicrobium sp.]|nr:autotransporter-associated beta strand repeat-containing protein [Verrucomicrobium sp.]